MRTILRLLVLFLVLSGAVRAEWRTESFDLNPGWNGIYPFVDASHVPLEELLALYPDISEIWRWQPERTDGRLLDESLVPTSGLEWAVWRRGLPAESNFTRLHANFGYLVRLADNASPLTLAVRGRPVLPEVRWRTDGLNLVGFPVKVPTGPRIVDYLAASNLPVGSAEILRYVGGPLQLGANPRPTNPSVSRLTRGAAYWVRVNGFSRYYGPLKVELGNEAGLHFGETGQSQTLVLSNLTNADLAVTLSRSASEAAPAGQAPIAGTAPLAVRPSDADQFAALNTPFALNLSAGERRVVAVRLDRLAMGGAGGDRFASLLKIAAADEEVYLAASAVKTTFAGLWIGEARIDRVGSVVKRYRRDEAGSTVFDERGRPDLLEDKARGLRGEYFRTADLSGDPVAVRNEVGLDLDVAGANPPPAEVLGTQYSARWTGFVTAPSDGAYTLQVASDTGASLWAGDLSGGPAATGSGVLADGFLATFDLATGPVNGGPADGISFAVGELGSVPWGEGRPLGDHHLAVVFDTFENGGGVEGALGIRVWVDGVHRAHVPINPYTDGKKVPVVVSYSESAGLTVVFNGQVAFAGLDLAGFALRSGDRFGFSARTGGLAHRSVIDNVAIVPRFVPIYLNDFTGGPGAVTLRGHAAWEGDAIRLTENAGGQIGSAVLEGVAVAPAQTGFDATFELTTGPGTLPPADGVSFAVGDPGAGAWGEDAPASSHHLAIGFDTYENNSGQEGSLGIHLWVDGIHVAYNSTDPCTGGTGVPVRVHYDATTGLSVLFDGETIFGNLAVPGFALQPGDQFGFGARTGGASHRSQVDNVTVTPRFGAERTGYRNDFDTTLGGAILLGSAAWKDGALRLTEARFGQIGAVLLDYRLLAVSSTGPIALAAGQSLPVRVEYTQEGAGSAVQLRWEGPGIPLEVVPLVNLRPAADAGGTEPELPATSRPYPLRLLVHVDAGGNATLLSHVYHGPLLGAPADDPVGLTLQEADLDPFALDQATRLSAAHLPLDTTSALGNQFRPGGRLNALVLTAHDADENPFLHVYHPDHDNLDARFESPLPAGIESFQIRREIRLDFDAIAPGGVGPEWGSAVLTGHYREDIQGVHKETLGTQGAFALQKVSNISTLTTP